MKSQQRAILSALTAATIVFVCMHRQALDDTSPCHENCQIHPAEWYTGVVRAGLNSWGKDNWWRKAEMHTLTITREHLDPPQRNLLVKVVVMGGEPIMVWEVVEEGVEPVEPPSDERDKLQEAAQRAIEAGKSADPDEAKGD